MRRSRLVLLALLVVMTVVVVVGCRYRGYLAGLLPGAAAEGGDLSVPPGFRIAVYATEVPNARQMALGSNGIVFVGSRSEGKVYAVVDRDGDHRVGAVHVLARGLNNPSGVAFRDGVLYVAAVSRILRFPDVARDLTRPPGPEVVSDAYPADAHHGWKFIAFGPDGRLYVPVGAPCNVCAPSGPLYATITRLDVKGGRPEIVAQGVRNSVGFDFQPGTGSATSSRPTSSTGSAVPVSSTSGFPIATATACAIPSTTPVAPASSSRPPRGCSGRTSRRSACGSIPARCSRRSTAAASSSPSTARGTGAPRSGIA